MFLLAIVGHDLVSPGLGGHTGHTYRTGTPFGPKKHQAFSGTLFVTGSGLSD